MNLRHAILILLALTVTLPAQKAPYDKPPEVKPPYYRVRFEASGKPGELIFPVQYTVWIPAGVKQLRGVVVHQHGCGEGSCKSGQTGAFDLHWQALAKKHDCALLAPSYEQPQKADCQMWCDPRNGSSKAFQEALVELGKLSGHAELATVPEQPSNRFGRPLFQGLQYSDTPTVPLAKMEYTLKDTVTLNKRSFKVMTVNTAGLQSK